MTTESTAAGIETARMMVLEYATRMFQAGLVQHTAGNVSCRLADDPGLIAVTPANLPYERMEMSDICIVNIAGELVSGSRSPTSELPLHTQMYRLRPDINGTIHTHSSYASVLAATGSRLPALITPLVSAAGGDIVTAPYARAATAEMVDHTQAALADRSVCFLRQHGVLAIGPTLDDAYNAAAVVEHAAFVFLTARSMGEPDELPPEEIERVREKWKRRWPD